MSLKIKKGKREIKQVHYKVQRVEDFQDFTEMKTTKQMVFDALLNAVDHGVTEKRKVVDIFKLSDTKRLTIKRIQWKDALVRAMEFYSSEDVQEYEKATQCRDLIETL